MVECADNQKAKNSFGGKQNRRTHLLPVPVHSPSEFDKHGLLRHWSIFCGFHHSAFFWRSLDVHMRSFTSSQNAHSKAGSGARASSRWSTLIQVTVFTAASITAAITSMCSLQTIPRFSYNVTNVHMAATNASLPAHSLHSASQQQIKRIWKVGDGVVTHSPFILFLLFSECRLAQQD